MIENAFDQYDIEMEVLSQLFQQPSYVREIFAPHCHQLWEKNRYRDVLPNASTRVLLSKRDDDPYSDYINANHINIKTCLSGAQHTYIAASAPVPGTMNDWWRMIYEQNTRIVLMLTMEREKERLKAHRYWPDTPNKTLTFGDLLVTLLHVTQHANDLVSRHLTIQKAGESPREVIQLQYAGWPDHGAPSRSEFASVVRLFTVYRHFRDQLDKQTDKAEASSSASFSPEAQSVITSTTTTTSSTPLAAQEPEHKSDSASSSASSIASSSPASEPSSSTTSTTVTAAAPSASGLALSASSPAPILTHCSAGIGRTGTFIGLDTLLDHLAAARLARAQLEDPPINIFNVVRSMREQRPGMVQTKQQYEFMSVFLDYCIQNGLFGVKQVKPRGLPASQAQAQGQVNGGRERSNSDSGIKH